MATEKTDETAAKNTPGPKAPPSAEPASPSPYATSLASKIAKQGTAESAHVGKPTYKPAPAGLYEVTHGRILLGHEHPRDKDGRPLTHVSTEAVYAHKGAQVTLTAEEAAPLVAAGWVDVEVIDQRTGRPTIKRLGEPVVRLVSAAA